jgi:hypothetical protein
MATASDHWNHRVLRHRQVEIPRLQRADYLVIHEVYFRDGEEATPHSCTTNGVYVGGDSIEELRETLERMLRCLDKPVLDYDTIVAKGADDA